MSREQARKSGGRQQGKQAGDGEKQSAVAASVADCGGEGDRLLGDSFELPAPELDVGSPGADRESAVEPRCRRLRVARRERGSQGDGERSGAKTTGAHGECQVPPDAERAPATVIDLRDDDRITARRALCGERSDGEVRRLRAAWPD